MAAAPALRAALRALAAHRRVVTAVEPWLQSPAVGAEARMFAIGSLEQAATALEALHRPAEAIAPLERARSLAPGQHHGAIDARIARLRESAGGK